MNNQELMISLYPSASVPFNIADQCFDIMGPVSDVIGSIPSIIDVMRVWVGEDE